MGVHWFMLLLPRGFCWASFLSVIIARLFLRRVFVGFVCSLEPRFAESSDVIQMYYVRCIIRLDMMYSFYLIRCCYT